MYSCAQPVGLQHPLLAPQVKTALSGKADAAEVRGALSRTATSLEALLLDLGALKAATPLPQSERADWEACVAVAMDALRKEVSAVRAITMDRPSVAAAIDSALSAHRESVRDEFLVQAADRCKGALAAADAAHKAGMSRLEASLSAMQATCTSSTTLAPKGRWLWRSGELSKGGWVPWEAQAANERPEALVWRAGAAAVTATVPGLYRLSLGFFTHTACTIQVKHPPRPRQHRSWLCNNGCCRDQVCINGEPVLTRAPISGFPGQSSDPALPANEANYALRRSRHSAGDVSYPCSDNVGVQLIELTPPARFSR